jgi:Domain of unknown function (DUF4349)
MRKRLLAGSLLTAVAVSVSACGSSSTDATADANEPQALSPARPQQDSAGVDFGTSGAALKHDVQQRAVISTGQIELTSTDVAAARGRVDALLARQHGRIADENTNTDERGIVTSAHLVLRVPSDRFDQTMTELAGVATLRSSTRQGEDVTTKVIDTEARIKAQQAGVRRLRDLVSRAANLPALLAVERELTARQGELESLQQQRAYLADRTSQATITVDIARHVTRAVTSVEHSTGGFVGGLHHGWHGLVVVVVGLLIAFGAVLPFAIALALVGVPLWFVARRFRREPEPEAPAET